MLERALVAEGYEVSVAPDGETALARVERSLPDLIVLNMNLPGLDVGHGAASRQAAARADRAANREGRARGTAWPAWMRLPLAWLS
jgi:CheY-like chemotaxis protein